MKFVGPNVIADGAVLSDSVRATTTVKVRGGDANCGGVLAKDTSSAAFNTMSTVADTVLYSVTIPALSLGATGAVRLTIFGDMLMNSGAPTLTFSVKLNGTVIWADVSAAYGAVAVRMPWRLELILANVNANAQVMGGQLLLNNAVAATTGEGDLGAVSKVATNVYGTAAENTGVDSTLSVTVKPSVSNVNVEVTRKLALLEFIPP